MNNFSTGWGGVYASIYLDEEMPNPLDPPFIDIIIRRMSGNEDRRAGAWGKPTISVRGNWPYTDTELMIAAIKEAKHIIDSEVLNECRR